MRIASLAARAMCGAAMLIALTAERGAAQRIESRYSSLKLTNCRETVQDSVSGLSNYDCRGINGIRVWLGGSDERASVSYGPNAPNEPAGRHTFNPMNSTGETVEWRGVVTGGVFTPFATILRWTLSDLVGDPPRNYQVLVVTRLAPGPVCHVGYVDATANPGANVLARQLADVQARGFRCAMNRKLVAGKAGPGTAMIALDADIRR
jgi:hypothetical protein